MLALMEPNYGWLQGLEQENAEELTILFRDLKRNQERAAGPGAVMISDTGPTEGGVVLDFDQMQWLREDRARWLVTLIDKGFIDSAEYVERMDGFRVVADADVVRYALSVLRGAPTQMPPKRVPAESKLGRALTEVEMAALKRFSERAVDMGMRIGPHLLRLFMDWMSHHPPG